MAIATSPRDKFDYVLESDRKLPPEQQTVFELRALDFRQRTRMGDIIGASQVGTAMETALRAGLRGWRNFKDEDGNDVPFEVEQNVQDVLGRKLKPPTHETLMRLSQDQINELVGAITNNNQLSVDDAKN